MSIPHKPIYLFVLACFWCISLQAQPFVPYLQDNSWVFYNKANEQTLETEFEEIKPHHKGIALAKKNGKWGGLNETLDTIIPFNYFKIEYLYGSLLALYHDQEVHLHNTSGVKIMDQTFRELATSGKNDGLIVFSNAKGQYGIMDTSGTAVIPAVHARPPLFITSKLITVYKETSQGIAAGLYNTQGEKILPFKFQSIELYYKRDLKCVTQDLETAIFDTLGNLRVQGIFEEVLSSNAHLIVVGKDNQKLVYLIGTKKPLIKLDDSWAATKEYISGLRKDTAAIINAKGEITQLGGFKKVSRYKNGFVKLTSKEENKGEVLFDVANQKIIDSLPFKTITGWNERMVTGFNNPKERGAIDLATRDTLLSFNKQHIQLVKSGYVFVKENDAYKMLNPNLDEVPDIRFWQLRTYGIDHDTYKIEIRANERKSLYGLVSNTGKLILPPKYYEIKSLSDRYGKSPWSNKFSYRTYENSTYKAGVVSKNGEEIIPFGIYDYIGYYGDQFVRVSNNMRFYGANRELNGLLDTTGNVIVPPRYDNIIAVNNVGIVVSHNKRHGFYTLEGKETIAPSFHQITMLEDQNLLVTKWDLLGVYAPSGKQLIAPKYNEIIYNPNDLHLYQVTKGGKTFFVDTNGVEYTNTPE